MTATPANESDVANVGDLQHGKEGEVYAESAYVAARKRVNRKDLQWHIAAWPSDSARMPERRNKEQVRKEEHRKASMRSKVEHPFRVIYRQFGLTKVRFRRQDKYTERLLTLLALSNLWMARRPPMTMTLVVRPNAA